MKKSILMHLNREYVRSGDLDLKKLFMLDDCTEQGMSRIARVPENLSNLLKVVNEPGEPCSQIARHCNSPFECDYIPYCYQHVPEYSVFDVIGRTKLDDLISMGIYDIKDIPPGFPFTDRQLSGFCFREGLPANSQYQQFALVDLSFYWFSDRNSLWIALVYL